MIHFRYTTGHCHGFQTLSSILVCETSGGGVWLGSSCWRLLKQPKNLGNEWK